MISETEIWASNFSTEHLHVFWRWTDVLALPQGLRTSLTFDHVVEVKCEFPACRSLMVNGGSSRQEGEEKHVLFIVLLMMVGSQHVRHAAFVSNASTVIQVTSQLGSWVATATNASVVNEYCIIRSKKKVWEVYFLSHQQSNEPHVLIKNTSYGSNCDCILFSPFFRPSVIWFFCIYTWTGKKFNVCRWRVAFFPPSDQQLIQIVPQPGSFSSVHLHLINPIGCPVFLDLCCACFEHIGKSSKNYRCISLTQSKDGNEKVHVKALKRRKYSLDPLIITFGKMRLAHISTLIEALIGFVIHWN